MSQLSEYGMVTASDCVTVFFPTYRNESVFRFSLRSILCQSHTNLRVIIFDNGLADGYVGIRDLVSEVSDPRVDYRANPTNLGPTQNYTKIFKSAAEECLAVVLAADCGLRKDALSLMLRVMRDEKSSWVRPRAERFSVDQIASAVGRASEEGSPTALNVAKLSSYSALLRFFSVENIDGEFDSVSWAGSLISGEVWRRASIKAEPFRWHGFEQYVTMKLLTSGFDVAMLDEPLEIALVGAERYGTERPDGDYTRLETIIAGSRIYDEHRELLDELAPRGAARHLRRAAIRFLRARRGFRLPALRLLVRNWFSLKSRDR